MKGGYQIIDLKNKNFENNGTKIVFPGIYEQIESTRKPIHVTNIVYGGAELNDFTPTICALDETNFVMESNKSFGLLTITVEDTDVVSITVTEN